MASTASLLEVKSRFRADFRRFSFDPNVLDKYTEFHSLLQKVHGLQQIPFVVQYIDPNTADLLPINNDKNFAFAIRISKSILRILLEPEGKSHGELYGFNASKSGRSYKNAAVALRSLGDGDKSKRPERNISIMNDFRLVSTILDVDVIPHTLRRVRLCRTPNKEFGLYIRNGVSHHHTINGYETVPSYFVSRLDKDGIAYGTGLLAVDDEIVEVNGIDVFGKTLDQVTDMMVANSSNLIITVRPADQGTCLPPSTDQLHPSTNRSARTLPSPATSAHFAERSSATLGPTQPRTTITSNGGDWSTGKISVSHEDGEDDTDDEITAGLITL